MQQPMDPLIRLEAVSKVFAGTINGSGALAVHVTALASESTLARVVQLVTEAETQVSPTQVKTKKFERIFVPTTLALVFVLLFAVRYVVPFYRRVVRMSSYEYLEKRFGYFARLYGSAGFLLLFREHWRIAVSVVVGIAALALLIGNLGDLRHRWRRM